MTDIPDKNLRIWEQVSVTDPEYTKHVNQRGGFTSIDAMYNIERATAIFGPIGEGWGYRTNFLTLFLDEKKTEAIAICDLVFWWKGAKGEPNAFGPIRGMNTLLTKGRIDEDASKKAMTDALTKALSHLGFSADVFLGKFDDEKYVRDLKRKIKAEEDSKEADKPEAVTPTSSDPAVKQWVDTIVNKLLPTFNTIVALDDWRASALPKLLEVKDKDRGLAMIVSQAITARRKALEEAGKNA